MSDESVCLQALRNLKLSEEEITYSDKYGDPTDPFNTYEYRHVIIPCEKGKALKLNRTLNAKEWKAIGLHMGSDWIHYLIHRPDPHVLLFRRMKDPAGSNVDEDDVEIAVGTDRDQVKLVESLLKERSVVRNDGKKYRFPAFPVKYKHMTRKSKKFDYVGEALKNSQPKCDGSGNTKIQTEPQAPPIIIQPAASQPFAPKSQPRPSNRKPNPIAQQQHNKNKNANRNKSHDDYTKPQRQRKPANNQNLHQVKSSRTFYSQKQHPPTYQPKTKNTYNSKPNNKPDQRSQPNRRSNRNHPTTSTNPRPAYNQANRAMGYQKNKTKANNTEEVTGKISTSNKDW